jgi:small subunit ribosomal protein S3
MGQKVNPKGLRLGVLYNWNSRWFFSKKKTYRDNLIQDIKIREKLMEKFKYASVTEIQIERAINKITITIYSVKPGMIIGRGGKGLEDVKGEVMKFLPKETKKDKEQKVDLRIEPVKKPYLSSYFVGQQIAEKLAKGFPHRSTVHNTMNRVMESGAKGIKIQLGGRIAGAEISRREKYFQGTVPTSTIREDVDFAAVDSLTKSGYIGVKVWICKKDASA